MKQETNDHVATSTILERIKIEYAELLYGSSLSLQNLFAPENFRFEEFCKNFNPHSQAEQLKKEAETFGQKYGAWLENSKHYISCAWYLYPTAHFKRVLAITKNLSIGFYLNDVMGRDVFSSLSPEDQKASRKMIENMALLDDSLSIPPNAHPLEVANAEILRDLRDNSPKEWFNKFLRLYCYHLDITHNDRNVNTLGYIPDIYEYMDNRCHYAAVHHLVLWVEFSTGNFLDWGLIMRTNFSQKLQRLHWVTAAFPALANDLFSFESEVIDNECDSNLVMIVVLNNPTLELKGAIERASEIVRNLVREIMELLNYIEQEIVQLKTIDPDLANTLTTHLESLVQFIQASWLWQVSSKRYKRGQSIWKETSLTNSSTNQVV